MVKIKTEALQVATAKAVKGIGNLSILAITSAIGITVEDGVVTLSTTNNSTNVDVRIVGAVDKNVSMYACTGGELFGKLVAKTTSEFITLELKDNYLMFEGDGAYQLPLIVDEEGTMAKITPIEVDGLTTYTVATKDLKKLLGYNKLAVSKSFDQPIFTGYCVKDNCIFTYNDNTACVSDVDLKNMAALLPGSMVELFALIEDKTTNVTIVANKIKLDAADMCITGATLEGLDLYPTEPLKNLVNAPEFNNTVKVPRNKLASILDRLALFVDKVDKNKIHLDFSENALIITNAHASAVEQVAYNEKSITNTNSYDVDLLDLKALIDVAATEVVTLVFGHDNGICLKDENTKYVVPIIDDDGEVA